MSHGRYYIAPIRVTSTISISEKGELNKKPTRKEETQSKPVKIDFSNSPSKVQRQIYYVALSQYGGYGAAARAWCGRIDNHIGIN